MVMQKTTYFDLIIVLLLDKKPRRFSIYQYQTSRSLFSTWLDCPFLARSVNGEGITRNVVLRISTFPCWLSHCCPMKGHSYIYFAVTILGIVTGRERKNNGIDRKREREEGNFAALLVYTSNLQSSLFCCSKRSVCLLDCDWLFRFRLRHSFRPGMIHSMVRTTLWLHLSEC